MSFNPEAFGFIPDDEGNINFMTIQTDFIVHNFEQWTELFSELVKVAYQNPGIMPIITFPDYEPRRGV